MSEDYSFLSIALVYCVAKIVSLSAVWISGYVAERDVNEAFTRMVYLERKTPPRLSRMVTTLVSTYFAMMVALICLFMLIMYLGVYPNSEMAIVAVWLLFDACITILILCALGQAITQSVSDQKYFNYKTEGLRAIRSVRRMLVATMMIVCLFPFAASLTAGATHRAISHVRPAFQKMYRTRR